MYPNSLSQLNHFVDHMERSLCHSWKNKLADPGSLTTWIPTAVNYVFNQTFVEQKPSSYPVLCTTSCQQATYKIRRRLQIYKPVITARTKSRQA